LIPWAGSRVRRFFTSYRRELRRLSLAWVDLGGLSASPSIDPPDGESSVMIRYSGRAVGWLAEPDRAPGNLQWIDPSRRWRGIYMDILPVEVPLVRTDGGWRVAESPTTIEMRVPLST
jgi:hypothetical protein